MPSASSRCLTVPELATRWGCRSARVRCMIKTGELAAFRVGRELRITPEAISACENGVLAVKPVRRRNREAIPAEVLRMLDR